MAYFKVVVLATLVVSVVAIPGYQNPAAHTPVPVPALAPAPVPALAPVPVHAPVPALAHAPVPVHAPAHYAPSGYAPRIPLAGPAAAGYGYAPVDHFAPANYEFSYDVRDGNTNDIKEQAERRMGDKVDGHYSLVEPDGTTRTVHYTADDQNGFNAVVTKSGDARHPITPVGAPGHYPEYPGYANAAGGYPGYANAAGVAPYAHASKYGSAYLNRPGYVGHPHGLHATPLAPYAQAPGYSPYHGAYPNYPYGASALSHAGLVANGYRRPIPGPGYAKNGLGYGYGQNYW